MLNGNKMWITNGPDANTFVIYAKTDAAAGPKGISAFIVEAGDSRFFHRPEARQARHARLQYLASWCSTTAGCRRRTCWAPARRGQGTDERADYERVVLAAGPFGIMQSCMDVVLPMCASASSSVRPSASFSWCRASSPTCIPVSPAAGRWSIRWRAPAIRGRTSRKDCAAAILFAAENATQMAL